MSRHVRADATVLRALYTDVERWAAIFHETIAGARVLRRDAETTVIEVQHVEGRVINTLRDVPPHGLELREWKRRYEAVFLNEFEPEGQGTRYRLTATVTLTWPYALAEPFLRPVVRARMRRYVIEPLTRAAEADRSDRTRSAAARVAGAGPIGSDPISHLQERR